MLMIQSYNKEIAVKAAHLSTPSVPIAIVVPYSSSVFIYLSIYLFIYLIKIIRVFPSSHGTCSAVFSPICYLSYLPLVFPIPDPMQYAY